VLGRSAAGSEVWAPTSLAQPGNEAMIGAFSDFDSTQ
jgi:hypothetical protein